MFNGLKALLLVVSTLFITEAALSATITVTNLNDDGPGSLRQALIDSETGDTVTFDQALNGGTIIVSSQLEIASPININALNLPDGITLSGGNSTGILDFLRESAVPVLATIQGLRFINGNGSAGGAIESRAGYLHINLCEFVNNNAGAGGAIYTEGTYIAVTNSTFVGNTTDNSLGAVYNGFPTVFFANTTIVDNHSAFTPETEAVLVGFDVMYFRNTSIVGNSGGVDIGFFSRTNGVPYFENSILVGNNVELVAFDATPAIGYGTDGYDLFGEVAPGLQPFLDETDQINIDPLDVFVDVDSNGVIDAGDLQDLGGRVRVLEPLPDGPAVDSGNPAFAPTTIATDVLPGPFPTPPGGLLPEWVDAIVQSLVQGDQRGAGFPRVAGARVDIGAVELFGTTGTAVAVPALNIYGLIGLMLIILLQVAFWRRRVR